MDDECECVCGCVEVRRGWMSSSGEMMGCEIMLFRDGDEVDRERREGLKKRLKRVLSLAIFE